MAVPTSGLVAYWKLDEASGTRFEASGTGLDLSEVGTVSSSPGIILDAADFPSGNTDYLEHLNTPSLSPGDTDFTIAAWVNLAISGTQEIITKGSPVLTPSGEYQIGRFTSPPNLRFQVRDLGALSRTITATSFGIPPLGTFVFVVAWHDSVNDTLNIQINDGPVDSRVHTTGIQQTTQPFRIGRGLFSFGYNGLVDEVGIWSRVLTAGERTSLYNGGAGSAFIPSVLVEQTIESDAKVLSRFSFKDIEAKTQVFFPTVDDLIGEVISTQTTPVAPTLLTATDLLTGDKVRLVWTGGGPFYNVFFKKTADVTFIKANANVLPGSQTQYDIGGLDRNVSYDFQVGSINGAGVETL